MQALAHEGIALPRAPAHHRTARTCSTVSGFEQGADEAPVSELAHVLALRAR